MASRRDLFFFACLWIGVCCSSFISCLDEEGICKGSDPGTISNCSDPAGNVKFELNWTPTNITKNHTYTVTVKTMDAVEFDPPFDTGYLNLTVDIPNLPDKHLYSTVEEVTCEGIKTKMAAIFKNLAPYIIDIVKCPFDGNGLDFLQGQSMDIKSPQKIPIPMGSYEVHMELLQKNNNNATIFCTHGWLIFANVTSTDENCNEPEAAEKADDNGVTVTWLETGNEINKNKPVVSQLDDEF